MKIKSIRLHPFAGIKDKTYEFSDGLNLMLGPNEAGKSTVFRAVQHAIMTPTNLTSSQVEKKLKDYFPVGGGDVIRVSLMVYKENDRDAEWQICKEWKPGNRQGSASLLCPDGTEITNEAKVQEEVENLLPVKPGTMSEILLSRQSDLHNSLQRIKNEGEIRQDIGGVLRKSVMETGGMSVDKFKTIIETRFNKYLDLWDRKREYPVTDAKGMDRGVERPWKRGGGEVLQSWYQMKEAEKKLEKIQNYEKELDDLNRQLETVQENLTKNLEELDRLKPMQEQLQKREALESRLRNAELELEQITDISEKWPVYEHQLKEMGPKLDQFKDELNKLSGEQEKASRLSEIRQIQKRLETLDNLAKEIEEAEEDLNSSRKIEEKEVEELRKLNSEIQELKTTIEASKLTVQIEALEDVDVEVRDAEGQPEEHKLKKGDTTNVVKNGMVSIETNRLKVNVSAGEKDLGQVAEDMIRLKEELRKRLEDYGVEEISEVKSLQELYNGKQYKLEKLRDKYQNTLADDKLQELKQQVKEAGDLDEVRELSEIQEKRDDVLESKSKLESQKDQISAELSSWRETYGKIDGVFDKRAELTGERKRFQDELKEMPELPEEFESVADFNEHLTDLEKEKDVLKDQKADITNVIASMVEPNVSAEEQQGLVEEATVAFEKVHREAESLAQVKEHADEILAGLEEKTYTPLVDGLCKWLEPMSDGRFTEVEFSEENKELPNVFITSDGKKLPFNILSHGTKDLTSLAWKLAITEKFLDGQPGFILLDDPLVDMDPERQKLAFKIVEKFGETHQVLAFTCHPSQSKLMTGGQLIEL